MAAATFFCSFTFLNRQKIAVSLTVATILRDTPTLLSALLWHFFDSYFTQEK